MVQETSDPESQNQISTKNQDQISRPDQGDPDNQAFDCPECGKTFGAQKSVEAHMLRSHRIKPSSLGGRTATEKVAKEDEETLVGDFKAENTLAASAVVLARNKSRLRQQDPTLYNSLFPSGQPESSTSRLADLEIARYIRSMRLEEETGRHNNGDSLNETALLRKELETVKEEMRKKDLEDLKGQIAELRQDMRHSDGSGSDLSVVVREVSGLLEKVVESNGPLRQYLTPDGINIQKPCDAPKLQTIETRSGVLEELRRHGLVTKIVERQA